MKLIISNSSSTPIYEQIINQAKDMINDGRLKPGTMLPSVRAMAGDLRISALTVKKAYDSLEQDGYIKTVHGKGSFVKEIGENIIHEEAQRQVEAAMEKTVSLARQAGVSRDELHSILDIIMEHE